MSVTQIQVSVDQNQYAVGQGFAKFLVDFKAALKAGNPFTEAVTIASAALTDLAPLVAALPAAQSELAFNQAEVTTAGVVGGMILAAMQS